MKNQENSPENPPRIFGVKDIAESTSKTPTAIMGIPQHGKTTLAKWIVAELIKMKNVKVRIFDSSLQWIFNTPVDYVFHVPEPIKTLIDEDGKTVIIYSDIFSIAPHIVKDLLSYDNIAINFANINDFDYERELMSKLILHDKNQLVSEVMNNKGEIINRVVYIFEESQTTVGSNVMRRKEMAFLSKAVSTGANWGLSFLIVTRRAGEVSTKIFEHTVTKCVTNSTQPNCLKKMSRIFPKNSVAKLKTLGVGEFLVLTPKGVFDLKTEKYPKGKHAKIIDIVIPKKKGFWGRLKDKLFR